jgi:hypothetical protein
MAPHGARGRSWRVGTGRAQLEWHAGHNMRLSSNSGIARTTLLLHDSYCMVAAFMSLAPVGY